MGRASQFATLAWVDWFNNRRLLAPLGHVPPAEYERAYYERQTTPAMEVRLN
jgi:putative transposase